MNVSFHRITVLALLLLPWVAGAQFVRPYPEYKVIQTDTFDQLFTTYNIASIVNHPDHSKYHAIVDAGGGQKKIRYSPENNFEGRDTMLVIYTPKINGTPEYIGLVFLVAPSIVTAANDYAVTDKDTPLTIDALDNDQTTSGSLTLSDIVISRHGTAEIVANQIEFEPASGFTGMAQIGYTVCNEDSICSNATVNVFVRPETFDFQYDTIDVQIPANAARDIMIQLDGYDAVTASPTHGDLDDLTHDVVTYTPDANFSGSDLFTLEKTENGNTFSRTFRIAVFATVKDRRFAMDDVIYTHVNTPVTFNVQTNDVGGYFLLQTNNIKVSTGTLVYLGNGSFTYTPNQNYKGVASFTYSVGLPAFGGIVEQANVQIHVNDFNPRLLTYSLQTKAEKPLVIRYTPPAEPWEFSMVDEPQNGVAEIFDGEQSFSLDGQDISGYNLIVYTPDPGFSDDYDEFEVEYCVNGKCKSVSFLIHVLPNPDPAEQQCLEACVWPGDANRDGVVNARDLLALGHGIGQYGPERANATTDWEPQFGDAWENAWSPPGMDLKYLDTDGDGLVRATDTIAISESYLNTHKVTTSQDHQLTNDSDLRFLVRDPASHGADTLLILDILYGLSNKPAYDAYGFTFEIDFADILEVEGKSIRVNYFEDSWFSSQTPTLELFKRLDNTIIHSGYTKTNGQGSVGYGPVGFVIVDDIEGVKIPGLRAFGRQGQIRIKNITTMDAFGAYHFHPDQTLWLNERPDGDQGDELNASSLFIYPNPSSESTLVHAMNGTLLDHIEVFSTNGIKVFDRQSANATSVEIPTAQWPNGLYIIRVKTGKGTETAKLQVNR